MFRVRNYIYDLFGIRSGSADLVESELETIDGVVAGTVTASKALVVGANKELDTLAIADGGLKLGSGAGTAIGATAAELNLSSDISAYTETLASSGAITFSTSCRVHNLNTTAGAQTNTIPVPAANQVGQLKVITLGTDGGNDCVITLTNVTGGSAATSCTFDDAGDTLILVGGISKWHIVKEIGVTMA